MDTDLFGYQRSKVGQHVISTDLASIYFSNQPGGTGVRAEKAGLVQSTNLSYQQRVEPRYESGSSELFWTSGQSQGTIQVNRLIGSSGILANVNQNQDPADLRHGLLGSVEAKIGRIGQSGLSIRQDVIVMSGCVLAQYGATWSVGGLEVQESMNIQTALMRRRRIGSAGGFGGFGSI